jgi:hypothetical protein
MGFLRSFGKFALGSLFSLSLALLLLISSLSQLTEYSNLKKIFSEALIEIQIKEVNITEAYHLIKEGCKIKERISLPIDNDTIELNCSQVEKVEEKDFLDFITTKIFEKFYFKEYPCSVIECLKKGDTKNFLIIFSKEGNLFFKKIQNYLILITAALCIGFVLVLENWQERAKGLGKVLFSTGLFYFIIKYSYSFFIPAQIREIKIVKDILNVFVQNFLYLFICGIVLLILGYLLSYRKKRGKGKK